LNRDIIIPLLAGEHKAVAQIAAAVPTTQVPEVHRAMRLYLKKRTEIDIMSKDGEPDSGCDAMRDEILEELLMELERLGKEDLGG
jgi:hypothetical protein